MWAAAAVAPVAVVQVPVDRAQWQVDSAVQVPESGLVLVVPHLLRASVVLPLARVLHQLRPLDEPVVPVQRQLSSQLFSAAMARITT